MKKITLFIFIIFSLKISAQIQGKVTDSHNKALSFVSIYQDESVTGTTSNEDGNYLLDINQKGSYTIVFQSLGYQTIKKKVEITSFPFELNMTLKQEDITLEEVLISTKENPANKIIQNTISNKEKNSHKTATYSADFYSRGLYKIKNAPKKFLGQSIGDLGSGLDSTRSGIIYLSETISKITQQKKPKKFKENIIASKVSGYNNGISFNRAEEVNFNFYKNTVEFGNKLISPISNSAFGYYNYKLVGTFYDKNGKLINKIKVLPKRKNENVVTGFIYIVEDKWALYGVDFTVTGTQVNIPAVDTLQLKQDFNYSENEDAWVLITQSILFKVNFLGFKFNGQFSSSYSNYNFTPIINKKTSSNEVLRFEKEATKKDTTYWNNKRPIPLTKEEIIDYSTKDSIKKVTSSKKHLDSIDLKNNKFKISSTVFGYNYKNSFDKWSVSVNSPITKLSFSTVQGFNSSLGVHYFKRLNDAGKWWKIGADVNYGFSEKKARPTLFFEKKWNNVSAPQMKVSAGNSIAQFNDRNPLSFSDNLIRSLFKRLNHMKVYEKYFAKIAYSEEIKNGIYLNSSLEYADRRPLFNTSNFSFVKKDYEYTSNNPLDETDFVNPGFTQHHLWTANIGMSIVFNQKYLSYPDRKFNLENKKYPSLFLGYRKTFGATNSELHSELIYTSLQQKINLGSAGIFKYFMRSGLFLKKKNIAFMDFLRPNANKLFLVPSYRLSSFGILDYYKFSSNDRYAEMHFEQNFKGFVLGKIPLINKLNLHLVGGSKFLFMADKKPYWEYSAGLDNIGFGKYRFFRLTYIQSYYNGIHNDGFVIGYRIFK